jgi:transcriptional regulator with XRE-family HTH domain
MSSQLNPLSHIDGELADRLENDERFRRRFIRFWAQTEVATEIRTLRKKRHLRQEEVAALARTGQSAISRIEKAAYDGWTFKTLITIAETLKARLRITFEPIETVALLPDHQPVKAEFGVNRLTIASAIDQRPSGSQTRFAYAPLPPMVGTATAGMTPGTVSTASGEKSSRSGGTCRARPPRVT